MPKFSGIDASLISAFSGKSFVESSGGIDPVPATTDSGIVVCPTNSGLQHPYSSGEFSDYSNPVHMYQLSSLTGVVALGSGSFSWGALLSNGDLYTGGSTNSNQLGISSSAVPSPSTLVSDGGLGLSLSGVSKVAFGGQGIFAIKTNGTLWWAGSVSSYLNSTGTGRGTTYSSNGWAQIGSDTDWYDIKMYPSFPYQAIAIKGSSGSRYLYACGQNTNYGTGQGTTSGSTFSWTRVKSAASTDLSESFSKIALSYGSCLAVTDSGKLFSWGENIYGNLGSGNTTDKPYATQVGSDTDWTNCWVQRYGGFALKSGGSLYMSTSRNSWRIEPSIDKTFTQIGTDTDYQDLAVFDRYSSSMNYAVFAKKGGSWYVSANQILGGAWPGSSYWSGSSEGTWTAINDALTENDITGTIDIVYPFYSSSNSNVPQLMFALS